MTNASVFQTQSSLNEWHICKRRFKHKYVDLVRVATKGRALNVGIVFHAGGERFSLGDKLNTILQSMQAETSKAADFWATPEGQIEWYRVRAMMRAYYHRWDSDRKNWEVLAVEREFIVELPGGLKVGGKWDLVIRHIPTNQIIVIDHKTSSDEIASVGADYWQRLTIDKQVTIYAYAAEKIFGESIDVIWDVVKKPTGKPIMKTRVAKRKAETQMEFEARKAEVMESLDEFEERLFQKMIAEPDTWLVRHQIHRTNEQQQQVISDIEEACQEIATYSGTYPRNSGACQAKYGTCAYLGVCTGLETLDSERFEQLETAHPELPDSANSQGDCDNECPI